MSQGNAAECERCGAPLTLAKGTHARCGFCLHAQHLPEAIAATLLEDAALNDMLDVQQARVNAHQSGYFRSRIGMLVLLAIVVPGVCCVGVVTMGTVASLSHDPVAAAMFAFLGLGGLAPAPVLPFVWMWIRQGTRARILAGLPCAVLRLDDGVLSSTCPQCGRPHQVEPNVLTATCSACGTEALLSLPLVDARFAGQHAEILNVRLRGDGEANASKAAVANWQRRVVPLWFAFSAFYGIGIVGFVMLVSFR